MHTSKLIASLALLAVVTTGVAVQAAPIGPGQTVQSLPPVAQPAGGSISASTAPLVFTSSIYAPSASGFAGTMQSQVILNDPSNPFGPGTLTFTYLISNSALSYDEIERFTVGSYAGILTDVDQGVAAGTFNVTDFTRSTNGNVMGVDFKPVPDGFGALPAGQTARLVVIQTNATAFVTVNANIINSDLSSVAVYAPAPGSGAVPEPTTALLALPGIALLVGRRRRASV